MPDPTSDKTYALLATPHNTRTISELEARGHEVLSFPFAAAEKIDFEVEPADLIERNGSLDWLVFADLWAVDFFLEALRASGFELYELDAVRILAVGEAVADRLRFVQLHADVIPPRIDAETVAKTLIEYEGGRLHGLRLLIVEGLPPRDDLAARLTAAGAAVETLAVYRFGGAVSASTVKLKALLVGGAVDEFIFTSPAEVLCFERLLSPEKLSAVLRGVSVAAASEQVFQSLVEHGLRPRFHRAK